MKIIAATESHVPAITEIYNQAVSERIATCDLEMKTLENRTAWFENFDDTHPIFVGIVDDEVCCYGCLLAYSPKPGYRFAVEHSLYVSRNARGHGYGKLMLLHLVEEAKRLKYHYLEGGVFAHNAASLALHKSLEFEEMAFKKEVANLDGRWVDVVLMVRLL